LGARRNDPWSESLSGDSKEFVEQQPHGLFRFGLLIWTVGLDCLDLTDYRPSAYKTKRKRLTWQGKKPFDPGMVAGLFSVSVCVALETTT
jgi:hypothetical protein